MKRNVLFTFVIALILNSICWNSEIYCQTDTVPREPYTLTPDVRFSPAVRIYNFTDYYGVEDGKYYLNFDLTIPKDGIYEVSTFSAITDYDDTDTVLRNYGTIGYSGDYSSDDNSGDDNFSKITFNGRKGEIYYFRVLPIDPRQNDRSLGICYECKKITEPKKFLIGMYTLDFDNPLHILDIEDGHCTVEEFEEFNNISIGNDDKYLEKIANYNFNCVIPWHQLQKPYLQTIDPSSFVRPDRKFLDRALFYDLDVILTAPGIDLGHQSQVVNYNPSVGYETIKYFDGHPAIISYQVMDEPIFHPIDNRNHIDNIKLSRTDIDTYSTKSAFIPTMGLWAPKTHHYYYVWGDENNVFDETEFLENWLEPFIRECNPSFLSSTYYLWPGSETSLKKKIRYIYHNQIMAKSSTKYGIDYVPVITPWKSFSVPLTTISIKDYNYFSYMSLLHGAKGIFYWAREISSGVLSEPNYLNKNSWDLRTDESTRVELSLLNSKLLERQDVLLDLTYRNSYHMSSQSTIWPIYDDDLLPECYWTEFPKDLTAQNYFNVDTPFLYTSGSPIENLAISFLTDSNNNDYFWIFNKNYSGDYIDFKINFSNLVNLTDVFSGENSDCVYIDVRLNACEAKLFKINRSFEINGIVRVPTGYSILMKSGEMLRFIDGSELIVEDGGNFILEEGANIQINGSAKIQGKAQIFSGANVSISDKSSLNLQLSQLTIHSNTDIEIGKSAKLIIANGTNFIAEQGSGFIVDESSEIVVSTKGYFTAVGTPFTYTGDTGKWLGLNCTGGSSIDLNNVDINEAETGVKGIYNYKFNVRNSFFTGCDNGISVAELVPNVNYNITGNNLTGTKNGTGISITSSNGVFENNDISFFLYGARLTMCSPVLKRNKIWGNKVFGILVSGQNAIPQLINTDTNQLLFLNNEIISNGNTNWNPSSIFLSAQIGIIPYSSIYMHNGKNHIYSGVFNSTPIIPCISVANMISSANQNIVIDAENNYWGSSTVNDDFFFDEHFQYSIDYIPYYISPDGAIDPDNPASQSTTVENTLISNAIRLESLENNTPAIKLYEHIIKKYVDSPEYYIAMAKLPYLYAKEELDNTQLITLYNEALQSVETSNKKFFKGMKVATHIKGKRYDDAITIAEEMKTEAEFEEEVILADINIAIANLLKNMESKGRSESDYTSDLMNLLNKLNGTQENGTPEEVADAIALPSGVSLYQNYPNPFNPITQIRFDLAKTSDVKLKVYNIGGQVVAELADGVMNSGSHTVDFDGSRLNSGVYYYTLEVNGKSYTQKMILMK